MCYLSFSGTKFAVLSCADCLIEKKFILFGGGMVMMPLIAQLKAEHKRILALMDIPKKTDLKNPEYCDSIRDFRDILLGFRSCGLFLLLV